MDKSSIAFPDQLEKCDSMIAVTLGDIDYQAEVVGDQLLLFVRIVYRNKVHERMVLLVG
jgi:hypothetical protein